MSKDSARTAKNITAKMGPAYAAELAKKLQMGC